jgi:hypothetical protein
METEADAEHPMLLAVTTHVLVADLRYAEEEVERLRRAHSESLRRIEHLERRIGGLSVTTSTAVCSCLALVLAALLVGSRRRVL